MESGPGLLGFTDHLDHPHRGGCGCTVGRLASLMDMTSRYPVVSGGYTGSTEDEGQRRMVPAPGKHPTVATVVVIVIMNLSPKKPVCSPLRDAHFRESVLDKCGRIRELRCSVHTSVQSEMA